MFNMSHLNLNIKATFATVPVVCSYCGHKLGTAEVTIPALLADHEDIVSHGICEKCKNKLLNKEV